MDQYLDRLSTELPNKNSENIDLGTTEEILTVINREDMTVPTAVQKIIPQIAMAVDRVVQSMEQGGRLFYFGAGTSGRLGVLDASECPPTYGVSPEVVQGYIAGGDVALRTAVEGCEDSEELGRSEISKHQITQKDVVVGITASGRAPYVVGLLKEARESNIFTIGVVTNRNSILEKYTDICLCADVGNEVIAGSTRMKSGTAQKLILNMLSTAVMIKSGKVYNNQMVDVRATNEKLRHRAVSIFCNVTGEKEEIAREYLEKSEMETKLAIFMYYSGKDRDTAKKLLKEEKGFLRKALMKLN